MADTNLASLPLELLADIQSMAARDENIDRVFLFGSRADGNWRANSDVDLAIQTAGLTEGERLASYIHLQKNDWEQLGLPFGLEIDVDHYEPGSGGVVAPAVE